MTKVWSREDTQHWIAQLEHRIEDIDYYLKQTVEWCEERGVYNDQAVFACAMMTVIWVADMRGEQLSKREVLEIIGIEDWYLADEQVYELGEKFKGIELESLLLLVAENWW